MPAPYDNRRYRTTQPLTIPAGTLILPNPSGSGEALSPDGSVTITVHDLGAAERLGVVRQLADGEA